MIVRFVDIDRFVDHHCLSFIFIGVACRTNETAFSMHIHEITEHVIFCEQRHRNEVFRNTD